MGGTGAYRARHAWEIQVEEQYSGDGSMHGRMEALQRMISDGGARRLSPLSSSGKPIIGLYGGQAMTLDRLGLICADKK